MPAAERVTVVSTKGQVILPKSVREQRHWEPGTRLLVEDTAEGVRVHALVPARLADRFARFAVAS